MLFRRLMIMAILLVAAAPRAEEIVLPTPSGDLAGTLLLPEGGTDWPVVLIIAGSGPTDRDGNVTSFPGRNDSLRQLAAQLAARGIASLRYDKRGVAGSAGAAVAEDDLRFGMFIDDAVRWCRWLRADGRFATLVVAGHSQGSQVGMNAVWRADADGFVSIAGPGRPVLELIRGQLAAMPIRSRVEAEKVLVELEAGRRVPEPPLELTILFRPSVQDFLISWQEHDPATDLARLAQPVLIVQGTTDVQVAVSDAERLAAARPGAELLVVEGMNHLLKPVAAGSDLAQRLSLVDPELQTMPAVADAVAALVTRAGVWAAARDEALERALAANGGGLMLAGPPGPPLDPEATVPERTGAWARRFLAAGGADYRFGLAEGGYAAVGLLALDRHQDCISLLYRTTELARAGDGREAAAWALKTRFAGVDPAELVDADGRVDYERPEHLDYSLDMIRSGLWGRDVTANLPGAVPDTAGTSRYRAGTWNVLPAAAVPGAGLREGDLAWLVLDPGDAGARALRDEHGLVVGHVGIIILEEGEPWLVHAASSGLEGWYAGGGIVAAPLGVYLDRVERYGAVIITRFGSQG